MHASVGLLTSWLLPGTLRPSLEQSELSQEATTLDSCGKCGPITVKPPSTKLSDEDIVLVKHLFAGEGEVEMHKFGAGFSGCDVYGCKSKTRDGTLSLAACVVKLGPSEEILSEAHKLEEVRQGELSCVNRLLG